MSNRGFLKAIGASGLTSILQILDRLVLNTIPVIYWGIEIGAVWIFLRSWGFVLLSLEGGVGGRISNSIAHLRRTNQNVDSVSYENAFFSQLIWGGAVFFVNALVVSILLYFDSLFFFSISEYLVVFILMGVYALLFFQTQLVVYRLRGEGEIFKGQMIANFAKAVEVIIFVIVPYIGLGMITCILLLILVRFLLVVIMNEPILSQFRSVRFVWGGFDFIYFIYPVSSALLNFIPILVVSGLMGASAVLVFSISRLYGRLITQVSQILSRVIWPELAGMARNVVNDFLNKILIKQLFVSMFLFFIGLFSAYLMDGNVFNGVEMEFNLIAVLLLGTLFVSFNDLAASILIAFEVHVSQVLFRLALYLILSVVMFFCVVKMSLLLVAYGILGVEIICFIYSMYRVFILVKVNG